MHAAAPRPARLAFLQADTRCACAAGRPAGPRGRGRGGPTRGYRVGGGRTLLGTARQPARGLLPHVGQARRSLSQPAWSVRGRAAKRSGPRPGRRNSFRLVTLRRKVAICDCLRPPKRGSNSLIHAGFRAADRGKKLLRTNLRFPEAVLAGFFSCARQDRGGQRPKSRGILPPCRAAKRNRFFPKGKTFRSVVAKRQPCFLTPQGKGSVYGFGGHCEAEGAGQALGNLRATAAGVVRSGASFRGRERPRNRSVGMRQRSVSALLADPRQARPEVRDHAKSERR